MRFLSMAVHGSRAVSFHTPPVLGRSLSLSSAELVEYNEDEVMRAVNTPHPQNNVADSVKRLIPRRLLRKERHPLRILLQEVEAHFQSLPPDHAGKPQPKLATFQDLSPIVTVGQNFDELLTPKDHPSRRPSDTFFISDELLLRCHTTAHQTSIIRAGHDAFLVSGDVYRRDTGAFSRFKDFGPMRCRRCALSETFGIFVCCSPCAVDASHYPCFHQCDAVRIFTPDVVDPSWSWEEKEAYVVRNLKETLEGLARRLFGDAELRWVEENFPFTTQSRELEVFFEGEWLEVLGCGMIQTEILQNCGRGDQVGWAFGLGLERLAMVLFGIPDIRLFWTEDERFLRQFESGTADVKFQPYSKYPPCYKDITFWLPSGHFHEHDFFELVRGVAGDLAESVTLLDEFTHPKHGRTSHCYRVNYRHMDRSLTNEEVDAIQMQLRDRVVQELGVELR